MRLVLVEADAVPMIDGDWVVNEVPRAADYPQKKESMPIKSTNNCECVQYKYSFI